MRWMKQRSTTYIVLKAKEKRRVLKLDSKEACLMSNERPKCPTFAQLTKGTFMK